MRLKYATRIETFEERGSMGRTDDSDSFTSADDDPVSKGQSKGKRNSHSLGKRSVDITEPDKSRRYTHGKTSNRNTSGSKADLAASKDGRTRVPRPGTGGLNCTNDYDYMDMDGLIWNSQSGMREHLKDLQEFGDAVFGGRQNMDGRITLIDVALKVKANNRRRDVPMISLSSKLSGRLIIGHPIEIEALESGSADKLLKAAGYFSPEWLESPTAIHSVRRTANSRVPRPQFVDENRKLGFSRNSVKKTSPSSSQKIKTLSSILLKQKHGLISQVDDGLIKTVPIAVACIPVNLVFSRLHEELVGRYQ